MTIISRELKHSKKTHDVFLVTNLKGLLQEKLWLLEDRLDQKRNTSPYKVLSDAQMRVLATLRGEKSTISEVARRLRVSRQAVHKIASDLVTAGLLELNVKADNLRDKTIGFTIKGEQMKRTAEKILQELEKEVENAIGRDNLQQMKALLQKDW